MKRALGMALAAVLMTTALGALGQGVQDEIAASRQSAVKEAIGSVAPAVVRIDATRQVATRWDELFEDPFLRRFFGEPEERDRVATAVGSGFIVEYEGNRYVLTNAHIVERAESIRVTAQDGTTLAAELLGKDTWLDLAVLALEDERDLPTASLGEPADPEVGDWAIAIGNPLGLDYTVTMGIISALDRSVPRPDGTGVFRRMIQTDAAINPGNSGGPLVNAHGEVMGMNTLIARGTGTGIAVEGINFAVPMGEIRRALPGLIEEGRVTRAWLGVVIQQLPADAEERFGVPARQGVLVADTVSDAPAGEAGIEPGDVIVDVDGLPVRNIDELQSEIMYRRVGEVVDVGIVRDREELTIEVELGSRPEDPTGVEPEPEEDEQQVEPEEGHSAFGLGVRAITPELMDRYNLDRLEGVVVVAVDPGSRAYWSGVNEGDLIVEVDRQSVASVEDWNELVEEMDEDADVALTVIRGGHRNFIFIP
ncbi:MAG: trypsin-like peptidase domain-containing protein [Candidatus Bipolaricaulota bacterium]